MQPQWRGLTRMRADTLQLADGTAERRCRWQGSSDWLLAVVAAGLLNASHGPSFPADKGGSCAEPCDFALARILQPIAITRSG